MSRIFYLRVLQQYPQASDKELARLFSTTPKYANVILQRLKDKGLISIEHDNGRTIKLTREGERLLTLHPQHDVLVRRLDRLIFQLRQLNRNLQRLLHKN